MARRPPSAAEDDEAEIEVVPQAPPRKPRATNPAVDDVIQSGEIVPRSHIIRSSPSIPIYDLANQTQPPVRRAQFVWLAMAVISALAAIGLVFAEKPPEAASTENDKLKLQAAAQFIGTTLDADAHATSLRVAAIGTSSMLRAGIETDAQTLSDMARDHDITLAVTGSEVIEVLQQRDAPPAVVMLRIPSTAPAIAELAPGKTRFEASAGGLRVVASAPITDQKSVVRGAVVLAVPVDLAPVKQRISEHTMVASLVGLGPPIVLVGVVDAPAGTPITVPIETESHAKLSLEAVVPTTFTPRDPTLRIVRFACLALSALLLIIFVATSLRRPSPQAS